MTTSEAGPTNPAPLRLTRPGLSLGILMLLIAMVAAGLAILRLDPQVGILVLLILVPATLRTSLEIGRRRALGKPMDPPDRFVEFFQLIAVLVLIAIAILAFLYLASRLLRLSPEANAWLGSFEFLPVTIQIVVLLFITFLVVRLLWPHRNRP